VAATVPAYRAFLTEQGVDPAAVRTVDDFKALPLLTKDNYLRRHPLAQLCRGGELMGCDMVAVSSGSTGEPTFWPRSVTDEFAVATRFEQVFHGSFDAAQRSTLAVVCFALGTWVGGMYTASCCRHLAAKGYPITVITPGSNVQEILRVITGLGSQFEQVALLGYPPYLKGVVDTGRACGVPWKDYHIKLVLAGEVFSEEWRTLMGERVGSGEPCFDSVSLYGTADAGVLATETPLSICIRRYLAEHPPAARQLFGQARLPTLAQYDPRSRLFETHDGTLLFTGDNGIPLVRYHIADTGGLTSFEGDAGSSR
jgi:phenylacetate-CoA ligase